MGCLAIITTRGNYCDLCCVQQADILPRQIAVGIVTVTGIVDIVIAGTIAHIDGRNTVCISEGVNIFKC